MNRRWVTWVSYVLSAIPVLLMLFSAAMKLMRSEAVVQGFTTHFGFPLQTLLPIGVIELACAALYLVPRTAILGAVLIAAYLGGATATELRVLSPTFWMPPLLGVFAWAGLWLRDARVRELLPLRR